MSSTKSWVVFIGVATVDVVLLIKLLTSQSSTDLLLAIGAVTTLLIFSFRFEEIIKAKFGKDGLQIELRLEKTENNLRAAQAEIEANKENIDKLFLLSMGPDLYKNLKKIASGNFGKYHLKPNEGLDRELRYLRIIGYIEVENNAISKIPENGENLSDYVKATKTGKDFVMMRELVEQHKSQGAG